MSIASGPLGPISSGIRRMLRRDWLKFPRVAVINMTYGVARRLYMQTKRRSFIEACINIAIGFVINITAQCFIFPCFDIHISLEKNLGIGLCFTLISITRLYVIRRLFNKGEK